MPVETYRLVVSPAIPTIPLFTLTGFLLAEGRASERLVRLFSAWFGWMPGGLAIVTTLVCAFFTTFTGASGVMILALGGLLLPVLLKSGYPERFSVGLLTATGSIGILTDDGGMALNIAIRTPILARGEVRVHVGGGIVADSVPEEEYEETLDRGRAMFEALA